MRYALLIAAGLGLAACQTNQTWTKLDGTQAGGASLANAKTVCELRAKSVSSSSMAAGSGRRFLSTGDAIGSGIARGIERASVYKDALAACMAERGFVTASM